MMLKRVAIFVFVALAFAAPVTGARSSVAELRNDTITLRWENKRDGWTLSSLEAHGLSVKPSSDKRVVLFSVDKPSDEPLAPVEFVGDPAVPEAEYRYVQSSWREATSPVALNRAG